MKKLFFLFTALLLISCSKDDDVSLENDNGFLTVYEDVVFLQETTLDGYTSSFWLIFSPEGVIEGGNEEGVYCDTSFYPWNVEVDGETYKVIQNSPNTLKVRYTYVDSIFRYVRKGKVVDLAKLNNMDAR